MIISIKILALILFIAIWVVPPYLNYRRQTMRYKEARKLAKPYETE